MVILPKMICIDAHFYFFIIQIHSAIMYRGGGGGGGGEGAKVS